MTDDQGRASRHAQDMQLAQQRVAAEAAGHPSTAGERAITTAADAGPVVSGVGAVHGAFDAMNNQHIANDMRGMGGTLNALGTVSSAASMRSAMQRNDASGTADGALGVTAGTLGMASAVAPVLAPAAAVAGVASAGYTAGSTMNGASGEMYEYFLGGRQERAGRGVNGATQVTTDNRNVSDRLADGMRTTDNDDRALRASPHLPVALGGERAMVHAGPVGLSPDVAPSAHELNASVLAEEHEVSRQRHENDAARGGGHRGEDFYARHPEYLRLEEPDESSGQRAQRVQREMAEVNRRHRNRD